MKNTLTIACSLLFSAAALAQSRPTELTVQPTRSVQTCEEVRGNPLHSRAGRELPISLKEVRSTENPNALRAVRRAEFKPILREEISIKPMRD